MFSFHLQDPSKGRARELKVYVDRIEPACSRRFIKGRVTVARCTKVKCEDKEERARNVPKMQREPRNSFFAR